MKPIRKVYGPYILMGYEAFVVHYEDKTCKTFFTHRLIAEFVYERYLSDEEKVHHLDKNKRNNNPTNLVVLSQSEHSKLHNEGQPITIHKGFITLPCVYCGTTLVRRVAERDRSIVTGKRFPFCNKVCSGIYGRQLQLRGCDATG